MGRDKVSLRTSQYGRATDRESLRVTVIDDLADLVSMTPQWERLLSASHRPNEFGAPAAVITWYEWFNTLTSGIYTLAVWRGDELVGIAPFSVTRLGLRRAGYRLLTTAGAERNYYGEPVLGEDPEPVAHAMIDHIAGLVSTGTTAVNFRRLWSDGAIAKILSERTDLACHRYSERTCHVVRFDRMPDPDAYFARVARKHQVPRRTRRLAERFEHIEYVVNDPEPELALDVMREMLSRRFEPGTGPGLFTTAGREGFARALIRQMSAAGHARVSSLVGDGERIVVSVDFHIGTRSFSYVTAYEPQLANFSLGHLELYEYLRHAYASGLAEVDLGSAKFSYKQNWANATSRYHSVAVTTPTWRGAITKPFRRAALSYRARRVQRFHSMGNAHTEAV